MFSSILIIVFSEDPYILKKLYKKILKFLNIRIDKFDCSKKGKSRRCVTKQIRLESLLFNF
jgi:hypothetical protein